MIAGHCIVSGRTIPKSLKKELHNLAWQTIAMHICHFQEEMDLNAAFSGSLLVLL